MARHVQFGIGIIAETHLLGEEAKASEVPGYRVSHTVGRIRRHGGVLLLVKGGVSCVEVDEVARPPRPIDAFPCILHPTAEEGSQLRITGAFVPPTAEAEPEMMESI